MYTHAYIHTYTNTHTYIYRHTNSYTHMYTPIVNTRFAHVTNNDPAPAMLSLINHHLVLVIILQSYYISQFMYTMQSVGRRSYGSFCGQIMTHSFLLTIHVYTHTHTNAHTRTHTCTHILTYTHAHTHIHTQIHTHTLLCLCIISLRVWAVF